MFRRFLFTVCLSASLMGAGLGCGSRPQQAWSAIPVTTAAARITPGGISVRGDRLYVKTTFFNVGDKPLTVERDAILLRLPGGMTLQRSTGITSTHRPYNVMPGASQSVWFDFTAQGFDWQTVSNAEVDFSQAVHAGAEPVVVPPMPLQARSFDSR